jgi:hypothetical protein
MAVAPDESWRRRKRFVFLFRLTQPNPGLAGFQSMYRPKQARVKPEPVLR